MLPPRTPLRIGPYRVETVIGSGGVGTVLRAQDERTGRPVAITLLCAAAELVAGTSLQARLERLAPPERREAQRPAESCTLRWGHDEESTGRGRARHPGRGQARPGRGRGGAA